MDQDAPPTAVPRRRVGSRPSGERGQTVVLFAIMSVVLVGAVALVIDASWLWITQQRMQRAADAAALAGAIYLPGDPATAYATARAEAAKNGFVTGGDVVVTPLQDRRNRRRLIVTVTGRADTFFARVMCATSPDCQESVAISATGRAEYVMPVPMGSPQNHFGVGHFVDAVYRSRDVRSPGNTGRRAATDFVAGGVWSAPLQAYALDNLHTIGNRDRDAQRWTGFGLHGSGGVPNDPTLTVDGIQIALGGLGLLGSGMSADCRVEVALSWDGGSSWSGSVQAGPIVATGSDVTVGSRTSTAAWGSHVWTRADFADASFQVRLTWRNGNATCAASRSVRLDVLEVRVDFTETTTVTVKTFEPRDVDGPRGGALTPQNFWAALQSQGAPSIQGDAFMTRYEIRTGTPNARGGSTPDALYNPDEHYRVAIELPPGTTDGEVWLFDPGFCDVSPILGTGEYWNVGGVNGNSTRQPASTYFDLIDTANTPFDDTDDTVVASSDDRFERLFLSDHELDQTQADDCSGIGWHNGWWRLADGLAGGARGRVFLVHAYSTDRARPNDQNDTTALNAYAVWAGATGGTPRVYGYGAMEAYVRLPGGRASEFYLAQIDAVHAGKTAVIELWDPGDTGRLAANLQILKPTASDYVPVSFSYRATRGTSAAAASDCNARAATGVTSVTTNTGGTSLFNGCWMVIEVVLPSGYDAPLPASDTIATEGGWWKIRYDMSGSGTDYSTDLTTWLVTLRGSPVHLVP